MDSIDETDLELLAALLDGRLSGEDKARALKLLNESDEALEVFAETVRTQPGAEAKVVPISTARRRPRWKVLVPAAAAAVLAAVMVPRLVRTNKEGAIARTYAMELLQNPRSGSGLNEGWDQRAWSVTRGGDVPGPGSETAGGAASSMLAFRLGVRSVDIQVALQRGDTSLAARLINEVQAALKAVGYADLLAEGYDELKSRLAIDSLPRSIERASEIERAVYDHLNGAPAFVFGQWVAAAELATRTHDAAFFDSPHGLRFVRSRAADALTADDLAALRDVEARLGERPDDRALEQVRTVLDGVIRRRGS